MENTVEVLASQVQAMKKVFDDANLARERQREFLDRRHSTTLDSIGALRVEIAAESQRFEETFSAFTRRGASELAETRQALQEELKNSFDNLTAKLAELDVRQDALDAAVQQEISDRKAQTARLVSDLQTAVTELGNSLAKEIDRRTSEVKSLTKALADRDELWTRQVDQETLTRELAVGNLSAQLTADVARAHRRQERLSLWAGDFFRQLEFSVAQEAQLRGATENSIVDSVTQFVEKFKLNLDREVQL